MGPKLAGCPRAKLIKLRKTMSCRILKKRLAHPNGVQTKDIKIQRQGNWGARD